MEPPGNPVRFMLRVDSGYSLEGGSRPGSGAGRGQSVAQMRGEARTVYGYDLESENVAAL